MSEEVKYCPECGKQVGAGAAMCPSCGHMFSKVPGAGGTVGNAGILGEGLMLIFIGLLIELASPAFGFAGAGSIPAAIGSFIGIGGLVVELIGFAKVRHTNPHFNKAWNYYIGSIACSAGYAIVSIIMTFAAISALYTGVVGVVIAMLVISIGFTIALAVLDIFRIRELMEGCAEIAAGSGDNLLAEKCHFAGKLYTIARGIVLAITVLVLILTLAWYGSLSGGGYTSALGVLTAIGVFGIILVIILCVQLAAQILVIVRIYQVYSKCKAGLYAGASTGTAGDSTGSENISKDTANGSTGAADKSAGSAKGTTEKKGSAEVAGSSSAGAASGLGASVAKARLVTPAPAKPGRSDKDVSSNTEDPVTMLKHPDIELEFIRGYAEDDEEKTILLTGEAPALVNVSTGEKVQITSDDFTLGRSKEKVDFRIENPAVSIIHARISKEGDKSFIEDLNSSNHTFVNGIQLQPGENAKVELKEGDSVKLAEVEFKWEAGIPAPAAATGGSNAAKNVFISRADKTGEEEQISKSDITLGRNGGSADIKVGDSNTVGRLHARIRADEESGKVFLKDEDSANGTFVNGKRLEKGEEVEIKHNDDIMLSDVTVKFRVR